MLYKARQVSKLKIKKVGKSRQKTPPFEKSLAKTFKPGISNLKQFPKTRKVNFIEKKRKVLSPLAL